MGIHSISTHNIFSFHFVIVNRHHCLFYVFMYLRSVYRILIENFNHKLTYSTERHALHVDWMFCGEYDVLLSCSLNLISVIQNRNVPACCCYHLNTKTLCMCRRIYTTVTARGASGGRGRRRGWPQRGRTTLQRTTTPSLRGGLLRVPLAGPAPEPLHGEQSRAVQRPPTPRVRTQVPPQPVPQDVPTSATR